MKKFFNFLKQSKITLVVSILFSSFLMVGYTINETGTIDFLFRSPGNILKNILIFLVITCIFYSLVYCLYVLLDSFKFQEKSSKVYSIFLEKHPFLIPFLFFLLIGLPIVIFFYPGSVQWDGMKQLDYFFGIKAWSNHHPVLPTLLMGFCVQIGRTLGSDNLGLFLFTISQYMLSCAVFSYILVFLRKIRTPKPFILITFLFFLFNPVWYMNGYTLVKDTMYYLFFILYFIEFIRYFQGENRNIPLLITAFLVMLFRNNGFYIVLASFIVLFLYQRQNRKRNSIFIISMIGFQLFYTILISLCGIQQGNIREMLSVPIQQTARYVSNYEVTKKEKDVLESVFHTSIQTIQKKYNPELSDPVKFLFSAQDKQQLLDYFGVWASQFLKHPKVYFDSFLENYYGYFYPLKQEYKDGLACFDIVQNKRVNTKYFHFSMNPDYEKEREKIQDIITYVRNLPILEFIFNTGTYTWILILFMGYAIYKKMYDALILSAPLVFTLLFCFLSPVNAYVRYMNPVIVALPIFVGYILSTKTNKAKKEHL